MFFKKKEKIQKEELKVGQRWTYDGGKYRGPFGATDIYITHILELRYDDKNELWVRHRGVLPDGTISKMFDDDVDTEKDFRRRFNIKVERL